MSGLFGTLGRSERELHAEQLAEAKRLNELWAESDIDYNEFYTSEARRTGRGYNHTSPTLSTPFGGVPTLGAIDPDAGNFFQTAPLQTEQLGHGTLEGPADPNNPVIRDRNHGNWGWQHIGDRRSGIMGLGLTPRSLPEIEAELEALADQVIATDRADRARNQAVNDVLTRAALNEVVPGLPTIGGALADLEANAIPEADLVRGYENDLTAVNHPDEAFAELGSYGGYNNYGDDLTAANEIAEADANAQGAREALAEVNAQTAEDEARQAIQAMADLEAQVDVESEVRDINQAYGRDVLADLKGRPLSSDAEAVEAGAQIGNAVAQASLDPSSRAVAAPKPTRAVNPSNALVAAELTGPYGTPPATDLASLGPIRDFSVSSLPAPGMKNIGLDPARELAQAQAQAQMSQLAREATGLGSAAAGATSPAARGFGSGLSFAGSPGALASSVPPGGFSYTDDTSIPSPAMANEARSPVQTASLGPLSLSNADRNTNPSAMDRGVDISHLGGPSGSDVGFSQMSGPVSGLMGDMNNASYSNTVSASQTPQKSFSQPSAPSFGPSFSADVGNAFDGLDLTSEISRATNISNNIQSGWSQPAGQLSELSTAGFRASPSIAPEPVSNLAPLSIGGIQNALGRTAAPAAPPRPARQVSVPAPTQRTPFGLVGGQLAGQGRVAPGAAGNAGGLFGGNTPTVADVFGANSFQASVFGADTGVLGGGGGFLDTGGLFGSFGSSPSGSGGGSSFAQDVFDQSNNDFGF